MQKVVAKMVGFSVSQIGESESVNLSAVTSGSEENKSFAKFTPSANLQMVIDNPDAQGFFKQGEEYIVTFQRASDFFKGESVNA